MQHFRNTQHWAKFVLGVMFILTLAACGGGSPQVTGDDILLGEQPWAAGLPGFPATQPGVGMPQLPPDGFELTEGDKESSATYFIYFRDMVNEQSWGRWSASNNSGQKQ